MQNTVLHQSMKNEYDAANVCIYPAQYFQATRSAFAYERPVCAYVITFIFD